jgi:hypothetical protein
MNVLQLKQITNSFNLITGSILTFIGIIGNTLVIYILAHKQFRKIPMFRYFIVSAIVQTLRIILFWPYDVENAFITILSTFACQICSFLVNHLRNYIAWIEVVISIDRYVSIMHPHSFRFRDKLKFQISILILIFLMSSAAYSPYYIYSGLYNNTEDNKIYTYCNIIDYFVAGIWVPFYDLIISTGLPFTIMLFTTCRVGFYLVKNKKNIKSEKEMKLFKILLGMNMFFFFFYLQWLILQLVYQLTPPAPLYIQQMFQIWYIVSNFMNSTYCSVTFFVHFFCNSQFRKYFKSMFGLGDIKNLNSISTSERRTTNLRLFSVSN